MLGIAVKAIQYIIEWLKPLKTMQASFDAGKLVYRKA